MSERLKDIYEIYTKLKLNNEESGAGDKGDYKEFMNTIKEIRIESDHSKPAPEIGELYIVDGKFMFLLTGEVSGFFTGFKVTEWVDFATQNDFVFKFETDEYFAFMDYELYIPKNLPMAYVGILEDKYVDVLFEYTVNGVDIPKKYKGLTIPIDDENYYQVKFRNQEIADVLPYHFNQFEVSDVIFFSELKDSIKQRIEKINYPKAAATAKHTARKGIFSLYFDRQTNILKIILDEEYVKKNALIRVQIEDDEFICLVDKGEIEIEIFDDNIIIPYLADKIDITNA
jgi:hypothetical protein